ncbi:MAG: tetratricopeptide repeat protein [Cyanobacteria bacterium J06598_4]
MRAFLISLISLVLIGGCHIIDPLNYDKETGAPEGAIEERHAWGNQHLGISYQQVITWLTQAEIVQENIGDVITVAPVGKPNFISSYFTDGLIGTFTLEVVGSEGKAIFSASGTAPCSMGGTCFNRGTLIVNGEDIAVHSSGISLKEFNKPENKIVSLSKEIQFYNRKYPESKNDPSKSNTSILNLWVERAEAYAKLKQYDRAIADIEVAISLFDQRNPSLS